MAIDQFEIFHGIVLAKLVQRDVPVNVCLIEKREDESRSAYRINDVIMYVKHARKPAHTGKDGRSAWQFTLSGDDLQRLRALRAEREVHIALVCGQEQIALSKDMQVCLLHPQNLQNLIDWDQTNQQALRVTLREREYLCVSKSGSGGDPIRVPRTEIDNWRVPGS